MEIPAEIIYTACGTLGTAIVALWRRQVASEKRCQRENDDLAKRLRQIEDFQRDKLFGLLTKAVVVLKAHGVEVDETPKMGHRQVAAGIMATIFLLVPLMLAGCFGAGEVKNQLPEAKPLPLPAWNAPVAAPGETPEAKRVRLAEARVTVLSGSLAEAKADLASSQKAESDAKTAARLAPIYATITWITWLSLLVSAAGAVGLVLALFWQIPIGRNTMIGLVVGGIAAATIAQGFGLVLPWLPVLFLGLVVVGALVVIAYMLRQWIVSHHSMAESYHAMAAALEDHNPELRKELDVESRAAQALLGKGVRAINDRILGLVRK